MKTICLLLFICFTVSGFTQEIQSDDRNRPANRTRGNNAAGQAYNRLYEYNFVERKPIFRYSKDTLQNFYVANFIGIDSLASYCIEKGDTAKYIRVNFEFIIDENGTPYDGNFLSIGTTKYAGSSGFSKIKYVDNLKEYFDKAIKQMVRKIPNWYPAMQNNVRVNCIVKDYFQFWLGINPEPK